VKIESRYEGGVLSSGRIETKNRPSPHEIARAAAELAYDKKGEEICIIDLREFSVGCDYFVVISCKSEPHMRAVMDSISKNVRERMKEKPWHIEGTSSGRWILVDYVDVVVHIFHEDARQFYMIERLWGDAPREKMGSAPAGLTQIDPEPTE